MKSFFLLLLCFLFSISAHAQILTKQLPKSSDKQKPNAEKDDLSYEMKHKNSAWYSAMSKPNADYFAIKKSFDTYFGSHKWEYSKTRELGENWIKSKIFYLDKNGIVQAPPPFDDASHILKVENTQTTATTRTVGSWTMIGPVNSASTTYSSKYNHGGYVYLNRIDPTNPSKMFLSFVTGGMWMTSDGGTNWTLTDTNMPDEAYSDIDVCRDAPSTVYAISTTRVIKSTDGGLNWTATTLTSSGYSGTAYDIAVSPTNPNVVLARWSSSIYRSADGGTTWSQVQTSLPNYSIWDCSIHSEMLDWSSTDDNVVYCLSTSNNNQVAVYRSADAGVSFSLITTITLDAAANGQIVGWAKLMLPSNNSTAIYVAMGSGSTAYAHHAVHLYKLDNTTGAEILKRVNMRDGLTDATGVHHGDIVMDKTNENKIVYGTYSPDKVYYSSDNGLSFLTSSATHSDIRSVDMVSNKVLVGSDGEAAVSTDGGATLATITNSISNHELWGFGSAFKSDLVASGNNHGPAMVKESGSGFEWYNLSGADQGNTDVNPLDDRYIYSQGYSNYRYFRTGVHTMVNESNFLDAGGIYAYFNSMEFHPNLYYSLITHHAGQYPTGNPNLNTWKNSLIRTEDNGASISIVKTFSGQVFREKICMTNPNIIYVVVGLSNNRLWKTTDGGTNWTDVTPSASASSNQTNISDVAVADADPNQVWLTYSGVQSSCKVLKSADGGTSWTNLTEALLTTSPITKIIFQRGSNGGVYVGNKNGVFYKNNSMANWVALGNGLPALEIRFMFINYNLGKLRIGTSRGAWEHNLYETSPPMAQISANTNKIICTSSEQIKFKDYSTVRNASATWAWSFPGGTPSTSTLENPVVSYTGAANGSYNVSLTVTDNYGSSSQTLTNFIQINGTDCAIEPVPGKLLTLSAAGDYAQQASALNITTNTITLSCWIKPNGNQASYAGIIFSASGGATGLDFRSSNQLGYHWANAPSSYNYAQGPTVPIDVWSHVALVVTASSATLYLNGMPYTNTTSHSAVNFNSVFQFGIDRSNTARNFKGLIDEVCIYNRALSTNEIRELMSLTRNNSNSGSLPAYDASLIGYFQFNEGAGKPIYDKAGGNHASLAGNAVKTAASSAPVGGGTFQRIDASTGGLKDFTTPGVELTFPTSGTDTYPGGDLVVTKLTTPSDQLASSTVLPSSPQSYYVIRNFGTNSTFTALSSIKFKNVDGTSNDMVSSPSALKLFKRSSNEDGSTWATSIDNADVVTNNNGVGTVTFSTGLNLTSFSQFSIGVNFSALPVQLLSFTATSIDNKTASLIWKTAQEENFKQYEIERSSDLLNFKKIGVVFGTGETTYTFNDLLPQYGNNYYRLKMVDKDGSFSYSKIKSVEIASEAKLSIGPNPSSDGRVTFSFVGVKNKPSMSLSITNAMGLLTKTLYLSDIQDNTKYMIGIDKPGAYIVKISLSDGQTFSQKIAVTN